MWGEGAMAGGHRVNETGLTAQGGAARGLAPSCYKPLLKIIFLFSFLFPKV